MLGYLKNRLLFNNDVSRIKKISATLEIISVKHDGSEQEIFSCSTNDKVGDLDCEADKYLQTMKEDR